tara:strand:+ start:3236 stop:3379 length:144 start_codon:yes stop_codon:yes gene_type:complete
MKKTFWRWIFPIFIGLIISYYLEDSFFGNFFENLGYKLGQWLKSLFN